MRESLSRSSTRTRVGTRQDVLASQEIERTTGAAEFLEAGDGAGLGREPVDCIALLAEAGRGFGLVVAIRAVETAVDLGQLVLHVADLEVAPQAVVLTLAQLDVELAHRRRHFLDHRVVAEGRVVVVRIDAPEQRVG